MIPLRWPRYVAGILSQFMLFPWGHVTEKNCAISRAPSNIIIGLWRIACKIESRAISHKLWRVDTSFHKAILQNSTSSTFWVFTWYKVVHSTLAVQLCTMVIWFSSLVPLWECFTIILQPLCKHRIYNLDDSFNCRTRTLFLAIPVTSKFLWKVFEMFRRTV